MNNGDIIRICNLIRNRDAEGEDLRDSEWSTLITANSQKLFSRLLGIPNLYQTGLAVERRGAEISRVVSRKLSPFYVRESVPVVAQTVDLSAKNIGYLLAVEPNSITGRGFDELEPSEVADRLGDTVVQPTVNDPCLEYTDADTILIYPQMSPIILKYYTFPTDAVVVHTVNSTTLLKTYDAASSTETGWEDTELMEIAYMCLRDLGVNMERVDIAQYAQTIVEND